MDIQTGILHGISSISSNDQPEQGEYITEVPPAENQEEEEQSEEAVNTVSGNDPGEDVIQYIVLETGDVEPLEVIDYTAPLIVLCLFVGICAGCLLFQSFGRGLTHGD